MLVCSLVVVSAGANVSSVFETYMSKLASAENFETCVRSEEADAERLMSDVSIITMVIRYVQKPPLYYCK
jgi:hypothetical protein